MRLSRLQYLVTGAVSICLIAGCGDNGPALGTVKGTVTMDGQPVPWLSVTFVPEGPGTPSYGGTNEKGEYRLLLHQNRKGAVLGQHNVLIAAPNQETDDSGNPIFATVTPRIPTKYRQPGLLKAEVKSGRNQLDFNLNSKEKP